MKFFGSGRTKLVAVFDIGSSSVGAALSEIKPGMKPRILQVVRESTDPQEKLDHRRFFLSMKKAFESVSQKLEGKAGKQVVDEVACFFSSPWYAALHDAARIAKHKPFRLTDQLLENAINARVLDFEEEEKQKYEDEELGAPKLIEKESMHVSLNGYEVSDYEKKMITEAEVAFFASVVPGRVLDDISEQVSRRFNHRKTGFHTFPFASYVIIRDMLLHGEHSFLLLDISGEMTDMLWVENGIVRKSAAFPLGKNFVLRRIAETLRVSLPEAESLLFMQASERAEKNTAVLVEKTLQNCAKDWLAKLQEEIRRFMRGGISPQKIFFASDENIAWWFGGMLKKENISGYAAGRSEKKNPPVCFLGKALAKNFCDFAEGVPKDAFLSVETAFLERFQNS
ncbi:MAG TPA: hypothetical protein VFM02_02005 [Candidatus Paceibacterota bacterium]|nr:hypothetical protein [Candidatus Paceibacterota bacterium]